jgi:hypothetical protein
MSAVTRLHVGDERRDALAGAFADRHQRLGQGASALQVFHEGAAAALHVEHQAVDALGELLGKNTGDDQRDALDRRGHVSEGVQTAIGGRKLLGLANQAGANVAHDALEALGVQVDAKSGNGFELVEGAAGVA